MLSFALIGVVTLLVSSAQTPRPYAVVEPENGSHSGTGTARVVADATASGGKYLRFEAPVAVAPPPVTAPPPVQEPVEPPAGGESQANNVFPDASTTGLRDASLLVPSGSISVTVNGTVIENLDVTGRIRIRANNVTIRNVRITDNGGIYGIDISSSGYSGIIIEDVEINGNGNYNAIGVYGSGYTLRRANIYGFRTSAKMVNDVTLEDNYFHDHSFGPGTHGTAASTNGGRNLIIRRNTLTQGLSGASSALSLYGDFAPVTNVLVENNIFNGGSYCTYGGSISVKPYPIGTYIRYINNQFGTAVHAKCGRYGPVTSFNLNHEGNEWVGNVWAGTNNPVPANATAP